MLSNRGWLVVGSLLGVGVVGVGCGPAAEPTDAGSGTDTGSAIDTGGGGAPDANRDAAMRMGDAFDAYEAAITAARREECECRWMEDGFKTLDACVEDQLATGDLIVCAQEGYNAARSASTAHYDCVAPALETYSTCRMAAGCGEPAADAITACVETVNAAIQSCAELPEEASTVFNECFQREIIGPASMCPEPGAAWMGLGTFTGTTALAGNDSNPDATCFPDGMIPDTLEISPERAYTWVAPSAGTFVFDTVGTEHDTILYVRSSCTSTGYLACNDDIDTEMGNVASRVMITATMAGQEFIVVVDGFAAESSGDFTVNVTMGTTPDAGPSSTDAGPVSIPDAGLPDAPIALDAFAG